MCVFVCAGSGRQASHRAGRALFPALRLLPPRLLRCSRAADAVPLLPFPPNTTTPLPALLLPVIGPRLPPLPSLYPQVLRKMAKYTSITASSTATDEGPRRDKIRDQVRCAHVYVCVCVYV